MSGDITMYSNFNFYMTDVSGGYHPSIIDAIRSAIHVSNTQAILNSTDYQPINVKEAFRLATLGGSKGKIVNIN